MSRNLCEEERKLRVTEGIDRLIPRVKRWIFPLLTHRLGLDLPDQVNLASDLSYNWKNGEAVSSVGYDYNLRSVSHPGAQIRELIGSKAVTFQAVFRQRVTSGSDARHPCHLRAAAVDARETVRIGVKGVRLLTDGSKIRSVVNGRSCREQLKNLLDSTRERSEHP